MAEEKYQCPECEKHFSSEETLREHAQIIHDKDVEMAGPGFEFNPPNLKKYVNRSFIAGFIVGIIFASAVFTGYMYWNSMDHRTEVPVTVVTCDNCSYDEFRAATGQMFNTDYREVDYKSEEGQALIQKYDLNYVPGFIFDEKVTEAENFKQIKHVVVEIDGKYVIPDQGYRVAQRLSNGISLEQ